MSGETEQNVSGWTVDTLRAHIQQQFFDLRTMLDERYATQTKAVDAAFVAQQKAMEAAFVAAERAVHTALASAEKAVTKAEVSADKRFEAMNEFRQALSDQAQLLMPRKEYDTAHIALYDKVEVLDRRMADSVASINRRMDTTTGRSAGYNALFGWAIAGFGLLVSIVIVVNMLTSSRGK